MLFCTFETRPKYRIAPAARPQWSAVRVQVCHPSTELAPPRHAHRQLPRRSVLPPRFREHCVVPFVQVGCFGEPSVPVR